MVKRARSARVTTRGARWKFAYRAGPLAGALAGLAGASACQLIGGIEEKVLVPAGDGGGGQSYTTTAVTAGGAGAGGTSVVDPSCSGATAEGIPRPTIATHGEFVATPGDDTVASIAFDSPRVMLAGAESDAIYIRRSSIAPDGNPILDWELPLAPGNAAVATAGNRIFVGGTFHEMMTIPGCAPLALDPVGTSALFVAELTDTIGDPCVWATAIQSTGAPRARAIAADPQGATYLTGELSGVTAAPPGQCTSAALNGESLFLAKFAPDGSCAWVQSAGEAGEDAQLAATVAVRPDPGGFVVAGGAYASSDSEDVVFTGGTPLLREGGLNAFLVSYDLAGNHRWSRSFASSAADQISGVAIDAEGNVIAAGHYQTSFDANVDAMGPRCDLPEPDVQGVLVMKLDANGQILWARGFGHQAFADGIAVDESGAVFVAGSFRDFIDFGGGLLGADTGSWHVFIAKLDSDGRHVWSSTLPNTAPGPGGDFANTAAVSGATLLVGGHFQGTVEFAGMIGSQTSAGDDGYLIGLAP